MEAAATLTPKQRSAMDLAHAFTSRSLTADFVAAQLGGTPREWAGVMTSLANRGLLAQLKNGFVGRTFWTLP